MNNSICGADCTNCQFNEKCNGCINTNGCPFGKECFVAKYIKIGGKEMFDEYKQKLINEFNALEIDGMRKIEELYPLPGNFVNLEYTLPNGEKAKFLDDNEIYLGNQAELEFDKSHCYGLVASNDFLLVCSYGENGTDPQIIIYKSR